LFTEQLSEERFVTPRSDLAGDSHDRDRRSIPDCHRGKAVLWELSLCFYRALLHKKVCIDATEPECADRASSRDPPFTSLPRERAIEEAKRGVLRFDARRRALEIGGGRKFLVLHGEKSPSEARCSRGGQKVSDICFDRSDDALSRAPTVFSPQLP